ncbi:beta-1,3-galactosyl-O-glycosyl-glycoprotein beta-1,6-N-acetylglucosaminyltransferase 3-like, partial [Heptranchias perlo]|uniref:beta-1,3-galactosyl-O-glycosyl-glycoprotein beta-1,6-N-acetylglucosaminyltransferase 3-like n=1 Tax=Heptranchias perlo TaxID=212740 RepID=UPI00355AAF4D
RGNLFVNYRKTVKQIISGDPESLEKALINSITIANKQKVFTEIDYLTMTRDCDSFVKKRKYITFSLSAEKSDFPLAYSMVIHEKIEMFERLLRSIYAPQNVYCVHVERKSPKPFHSAIQAIASCFRNVFIVSKLETVTYASWSRVQADLNCMEELLRSSVPWRYLINVCGQDFPMKTNREMVNTLTAMNGSNVIESDPQPEYKQEKWPASCPSIRWKFHYDFGGTVVITDREKSLPPPIHSPMFVGAAYILVTREFVSNLFVNSVIQAFLKWSEDTNSPDEHIWATLQRMPEVPGSIPYTPGHRRGNPRVITGTVKCSFEAGDVAKGAFYPQCTGRFRHQLCIYGPGDLHWIVRQKHLFANKLDSDVDNTAVECMGEYNRHRAIQGTGRQE